MDNVIKRIEEELRIINKCIYENDVLKEKMNNYAEGLQRAIEIIKEEQK